MSYYGFITLGTEYTVREKTVFYVIFGNILVKGLALQFRIIVP